MIGDEVKGVVGRVALIWAVFGREHRVRPFAEAPFVALGRIDLDADESIAEFFSQPIEALDRVGPEAGERARPAAEARRHS